jgi:methylmalonyl-CoA epimerase
MNSAKLSYVALVVRDPDAIAAILGDSLGMPVVSVELDGGRAVPAFAAGDAALLLFDPDDPFLAGPADPGLHHVGFACEDPRDWAKSSNITVDSDAAERRVNGEPQTMLDAAATLGVRVRLGGALEIPGATGGPIERIDHLGVASADNRAAVEIFSQRMGFAVESQQTDLEVRTVVESFTSDKYGVVYQNRAPEVVGGLRVAFITVGDCELEFLQNFDPDHDAEIEHGHAGTTKQDQGAITRFIERRGAGLHHLALKTGNIDETLAVLADAGLRMIDRIGRPGSRRARIGFVHPAALGGVLLHLVERQDA